jgi:hypothetical protein
MSYKHLALFARYHKDQGILNTSSEAHLWCLHYVFLPVVNSYGTTTNVNAFKVECHVYSTI